MSLVPYVACSIFYADGIMAVSVKFVHISRAQCLELYSLFSVSGILKDDSSFFNEINQFPLYCSVLLLQWKFSLQFNYLRLITLISVLFLFVLLKQFVIASRLLCTVCIEFLSAWNIT